MLSPHCRQEHTAAPYPLPTTNMTVPFKGSKYVFSVKVLYRAKSRRVTDKELLVLKTIYLHHCTYYLLKEIFNAAKSYSLKRYQGNVSRLNFDKRNKTLLAPPQLP